MSAAERPIYLDYNATTPHDPEVVEAMRPFLESEFGNPSSSHVYGSRPRQAVAEARRHVAALIGAAPEQIVFTSGGTESNNYAILGTARAARERASHHHVERRAPCRLPDVRGARVRRVRRDPSCGRRVRHGRT